MRVRGTAELAGQTCTAPAERSDRMRDLVVAHVPAGRGVRLLDIGCGTGSLLFRLADALPEATLVGIDISPANVASARARQRERPSAGRLRFEVADYTTYRDEPFDAIVSDGVLHLIAGDSCDLVRKLAADLRPGGTLVCSMPFACLYNRVFAAIRRLLGAIRSPWLDRRILQAGRLLHGRDMDEAALRERVAYMYFPPERMMDDGLLRELASAGLRRAAEYPMKSTSLSQLRHSVTVFARGAA